MYASTIQHETRVTGRPLTRIQPPPPVSACAERLIRLE
nr:MAG TPA: hypothetical protein [Caudoviricetes sp.]